MRPGITWYDILGVPPGASAAEIQREYDAKASVLGPRFIAGAPSKVITAVSRAQEILDAARSVLADPVTRKRYDESVGVRRSGGGLVQREALPSEPGWGLPGLLAGGYPQAEVLGGLTALTGWRRIRASRGRLWCRTCGDCFTACASRSSAGWAFASQRSG